MATISSTNPIVESYQHWWIEKVTISADNPQGVISCSVVLRLCRIDEKGPCFFHPSPPPQPFHIIDIMAVASEIQPVALTVQSLIGTIGFMARQQGIIS